MKEELLRQSTEAYWRWREEAACREADSSLFFSPAGERGPARRSREQSAKQVCLNRMARAACLEYALTTKERYGTWGGLTEEERDG